MHKKTHSKLSAIGDDCHPYWSRSLLKNPKFILVSGLHALSVEFPLASLSPSITSACLSAWTFSSELFIFLFIYLFNVMYLFLAALGLRCCAQDFSSRGEWGLLFVAVHGLLIALASLVAEHGF